MKALFLTEKYLFPGDSSRGLTNSMHNLIGSWECAGLGEYEHMFIDPTAIWKGHEIDRILMEQNFDFAFISPSAHVICSLPVVRRLKGRIAIGWWDLTPLQLGNMNLPPHQRWWEYGDAGAVNVVFDYGSYRFDKNGDDVFHSNTIAFETPQDTRIFCKGDLPEEIDVSFNGCPSGERNRVIDTLRRAKIRVWTGGGRQHGNMDIREYARIHKVSKICLNIQGGAAIQRKGRGFEIAACGKFMLANHEQLLKGYFAEGEEFVSFNDGNIVDKVRHYLQNPEEREKIAAAAHDRYLSHFSPLMFWGRVIKFLLRAR